MAKRKNKGLVHIYMGKGKGKTTAAIGLCMRASGAGMHVMLVQFLKGQETAEIIPLENAGVKILRDNSITKFLPAMSREERIECTISQRKLLQAAHRAAMSGGLDLIVLDEILDAIECGLVALTDVISLINSRSPHVEIVMTGRKAPQELIELSHYVSEINVVKHPYNTGIKARKGIEY